jgi:hypothetical protein
MFIPFFFLFSFISLSNLLFICIILQSINHLFIYVLPSLLSLGADSEGDNSFHPNRGFNFNRGLPHFRGHSGPSFNTPQGYGRGDMNAAWEVMSDEGSATGTFNVSTVLTRTIHGQVLNNIDT